jgi:hypothetical protein
MDTQPIGVQGLALNPNGDGRNPHDSSGQRQQQQKTSQETPHSEPANDHGLSAIAAQLGATLEHAQEGPEFYQIVA